MIRAVLAFALFGVLALIDRLTGAFQEDTVDPVTLRSRQAYADRITKASERHLPADERRQVLLIPRGDQLLRLDYQAEAQGCAMCICFILAAVASVIVALCR